MASEVGNGQVVIFPVFKGFRGAVEKETAGAAKASTTRFAQGWKGVGAKTGADLGRGMKGAFDSSAGNLGGPALKRLQSDVASASKAVSSARLKEQDAAGKLRVAEAALTEAKAKNAAGSARLVAAEEKAATASRNLASAEETTRGASARLSAAQARVKDSTASAAAGAERSVRSFKGASSALGGLAGKALAAGKNLGAGLAVGAAVAGVAVLGAGVRKLTGYFADSITTAANWSVLNAQTGAVIKSTGGAARVTSGHIYDLSQSLENQTATEAEAIQKGANLLLTFTGIRNEAGKGNKVFDQTTAVAVDMAKALGIDVSQAALQLGKALNNPAQGLTALTRSGVTFTDQQKEQIKTLVASGRTLDAQKLILKELNKEFGGSGVAYAKTYAGALYRIQDAIGDFGASIVSTALPGISKLLGTGADLINWAAGTNRVKSAAQGLADAVGHIADKAAGLGTALKGKNPLQDAFKVVLPKVDYGQFISGIKGALAVAKPALGAFGDYVKNIGPAIGGVLKVVGPAIGDAFKQLGPAVQQTLPALGPAVKDLLPSLVEVLKALAPLIPPLAQIIRNLAPVIKVVADGLAFLIKNGLQPLVQLTADAGRAVTAFASGMDPFQVAVEAAGGKFGPVLKAVSQFGSSIGSNIRAVRLFVASVVNGFVQFAASIGAGIARGIAFVGRLGQIPGIAIRALAGFVGAIAGGIGRAVAAVGSGIGRALSSVRRIGDFAGIATSAVGRFVGSLAAGFGRAVSAVGSGIGRVVATVRTLPSKVGGVLGNLGGILVNSGRALIEGFASGIRGAIGAAVSAARDAVGAVRRLFPFSPAKEGPFAGKGYTTFSGRALMTGLASGIKLGTPDAVSATHRALQTTAAQFQAAMSTAGSSGRISSSSTSSTVSRPITMDGSLIGWMHEVATGDATIVLDTQNRALTNRSRQGRLRPTFAR